MIDKEKYYLMALTQVPGLGARRIQKLLRYFQSSSHVFEADFKEISKVTGEAIANSIRDFHDFDLIDREIEFCLNKEIEIISFLDKNYPKNLLHIPDFPVIFFKKGNYEWDNDRYLSMVGTRKITPYGKKFIEKFIREIKEFNPVIVSGLAYGVDIESHKQALENNLMTIAVMGTSFKQIYPEVHTIYAEKIMHQGCLITEYWSYEKIDPKFFVKRNRIVAGLSQCTLVVESADKGGSLLTAEFALEYNRDVFAVPGRITDTYSQGCNHLIATNVARIFISTAQLTKSLGWNNEPRKPEPVQKQLFIDLNPAEQKIYDFLLNKDSEHLDDIALATGMRVSEVARILIIMELNGIVQSLPGKKFKII